MGRRTVLVTGFEPFGGELINPSQLLADQLARETLSAVPSATDTPGVFDSIDLHTCILPVTLANSFETLAHEIKQREPDVILCLGQAGGRKKVGLERFALNVLDFSLPDNSGVSRHGETILSDGPAALRTTLPIDEIQKHLVSENRPLEISNFAGSYICNYILYRVLNETQFSGTRAGFVHLPYLPEQAKALNEKRAASTLVTASGSVLSQEQVPSLSLEVMFHCLRRIIELSVR